MRWIVALVALLGVLAATAALREHYRTEASPCSINEKWDCGVVNHSPFAVIGGVWWNVRQALGSSVELKSSTGVGSIPVAAIGIAGYLMLGILAVMRAWRSAFFASVIGLGFSLYLTSIEAHDLQIWCIYCVISLSIISLLTILNLFMVLKSGKPSQKPAASS